jgi:hypothetical protein
VKFLEQHGSSEIAAFLEAVRWLDLRDAFASGAPGDSIEGIFYSREFLNFVLRVDPAQQDPCLRFLEQHGSSEIAAFLEAVRWLDPRDAFASGAPGDSIESIFHSREFLNFVLRLDPAQQDPCLRFLEQHGSPEVVAFLETVRWLDPRDAFVSGAPGDSIESILRSREFLNFVLRLDPAQQDPCVRFLEQHGSSEIVAAYRQATMPE